MLWILLSGFLLYICFRYDSYFKFLSLSFFLLICIGDAYTHVVSLALEKALKVCLVATDFVLTSVLLVVLCIADPAGIICFCFGLNSYSLKVMLVQSDSTYMVAALYEQGNFMVTIHLKSFLWKYICIQTLYYLS